MSKHPGQHSKIVQVTELVRNGEGASVDEFLQPKVESPSFNESDLN